MFNVSFNLVKILPYLLKIKSNVIECIKNVENNIKKFISIISHISFTDIISQSKVKNRFIPMLQNIIFLLLLQKMQIF